MELYQRNERDTSVYSRGVGVPPRIDSRERREAVFVDGLLSLDGIPIGVEGRGTAEKWEGREKIVSRGTQGKIIMICKYRLFSAVYLMACLFIALLWQGWFI